jgi:hypothetical protein
MNRFDHLRDPLGPPGGDALGKVLARAQRRRVARRTAAALIAVTGVVAIAVSAAALVGRPNSVHVISPNTTVPVPTVAPTSTSTSTSTTSPSSTTSTQPANRDGRWMGLQLTITQQSLGSVRVGMSLDQAQVAAGLTFDGRGDGAVYPRVLPAGYPHLYVGEGPTNTVACVGAEIAYADTPPQTVVTLDGLHLGDPEQRLLAIYGSRAVYVPKPLGGLAPSAGYVVTEADGNLAFMVFNARVVGIKGGAHDLTPSNCSG